MVSLTTVNGVQAIESFLICEECQPSESVKMSAELELRLDVIVAPREQRWMIGTNDSKYEA